MTRQNKTEIKQQISKTELYSGAVPHPALLKQFNEVDPTFAERIFKMAEQQNDHIIKHDMMVLRNDFISRLIGQFSMLFIVLCFLVFTFVSMLVFKNLYVSIAGIVGTVVCAAIRKFSK